MRPIHLPFHHLALLVVLASTACDSGGDGSSSSESSGGTTTSNDTMGDGGGGGGGGYCVLPCTVPADCVQEPNPNPVLDENNYVCEDGGLCRNIGCVSDDECPSVGSYVFTCKSRNPGDAAVCVFTCTTVNDCGSGPDDPPENYECIDGGCFKKPCTETGVCQENMACTPDLIVGDDKETPSCTFTCANDDDCSLFATNSPNPVACRDNLCVILTCSKDADCTDPSTVCTAS